MQWITVLLSIALSSPLANAQEIDPKLMKKVGVCKSNGLGYGNPILIIKQWHLSPGLNTKLPMKKLPAQTENLKEIETQLFKWVESQKLRSVVAEGCEGNFDDKVTFNGWSLADLKTKLKSSEFDQAVTHPLLKLEAKYSKKVDTYCGDLKKEIQEELLAFSDARAAIGYSSRISENLQKPGPLKIYLDGAIEAYHWPTTTTGSEALALLKSELKKSVSKIKELNLKRSQSFASTAMIIHDNPVAVVVGGLHAKEVVAYFEDKKRECIVLEPLHYSQDEDRLLSDLEKAVH